MRIRRVITLIAFIGLVTTGLSAKTTPKTINYGGTAATTGTTATYGQNTTGTSMSSASASTGNEGVHPRHRAMRKE